MKTFRRLRQALADELSEQPGQPAVPPGQPSGEGGL